MKKYPKCIGRQCIQIRIEVDNKNVNQCKEFYIKQGCQFLETSFASEETSFVEMIYYK